MPAEPRRVGETAFAKRMNAAMQAKAAQLSAELRRPTRYTYRDLADDINQSITDRKQRLNYTTVGNWIRGDAVPTPRKLELAAKALTPWLDYDRALIEAGYLPRDRKWNRLIRQMLDFPPDTVDTIFASLRRNLINQDTNNWSIPEEDECADPPIDDSRDASSDSG